MVSNDQERGKVVTKNIDLRGTWKFGQAQVITLHIDQESIDWLQEQYDKGETELVVHFPDKNTDLTIHFATPPQTRTRTP